MMSDCEYETGSESSDGEAISEKIVKNKRLGKSKSLSKKIKKDNLIEFF